MEKTKTFKQGDMKTHLTKERRNNTTQQTEH